MTQSKIFILSRNVDYTEFSAVSGGAGTDVEESLTDAVVALMKNPSALTNVGIISSSVPDGFTISIAVFAIFGNDAFTKPEDYRGEFDSVSGTFKHVKGYIAVSPPCVAVGTGLSSEFAGCGYSKTFYDLLGDGVLFDNEPIETKLLAMTGLSIAERIPLPAF